MEKDKKDVGFMDDALLYIENMVCAEHHAMESWVSSKDEKWMDILIQIRRNRSKMLYKLVPKENSEIYCFSKHILCCAEALKELANRYTERKDFKSAKECLDESSLYEKLFKFLTGGENGI